MKKLYLIFVLLLSILFWIKANASIFWSWSFKPIWFNWNDWLFTLIWEADLLIIDSKWNKSWYSDGKRYNEINWVSELIIAGWLMNSDINNDTTQFYMTENDSYTFIVTWRSKDNYDLNIKWIDYYIKFSDIEIDKWQIDIFKPSLNEVKIDFDDKKLWTYNVSIDNYNYPNLIFSDIFVKSYCTLQTYDIDWDEFLKRKWKGIIFTVDENLEKKCLNYSKYQNLFYFSIILVLIIFVVYIIKKRNKKEIWN